MILYKHSCLNSKTDLNSKTEPGRVPSSPQERGLKRKRLGKDLSKVAGISGTMTILDMSDEEEEIPREWLGEVDMSDFVILEEIADDRYGW